MGRGDFGTFRQSVRNVFPPRGPLGPFVRTWIGNIWRRVALRRLCCGHPGEPGC